MCIKLVIEISLYYDAGKKNPTGQILMKFCI